MPSPETPSPDAPSPDVSADDATKLCPYCAEVIKAAAIRCRYCQSDLVGTVTMPPPTPARPAEPEPAAPLAGQTAPAQKGKRPRVSIRTASFRQRPDGTLAPMAAGTTGAPAEPEAESRGLFRPMGLGVLIAIIVAVLASLVFLVLAFVDWRAAEEINESEAAARTVRASVADKVEALLSYDHATFDEDLDAAKEGMTADFEDEYEPTVEEIRERAVAQERSQVAEVIAVAVSSATAEEVETLVFVNTISSREGTKAQRLMQNRVSVTLVNEDGEWLIDELSVPQS